MFDLNDKQDIKQLVVDQIPIESDFIDDESHGLTITFPPLSTVTELPDIRPSYQNKMLPTIFSSERNNVEYHSLKDLEDRFNESVEYFTKLSGLARFCGDLDGSLEYAYKAANLNASDNINRYRLGERLLENGQNSESYKIFKDLDRVGYPSATLRLAELEISRNRTEKALEYASKAEVSDSRDWRAKLLIGTIHLVKGNYAEAINYLRKASIEKPNISTIYLNKGIAYFYLREQKKSIREAKKALSLNPGNKSAMVLLTDLALKSESKGDRELESAKYYLDKYEEFSERSKDVIDRRAYYFFQKGETKKGIKFLEEAVKEYDSPDLLNNLGVFWMDRNPDTAANWFAKAIDSVGGLDFVQNSNAAEYALVNLARLLLNHKKADECLSLIDGYLSTVGYSRVDDKAVSKLYLIKIWCEFLESRNSEAIRILTELAGNKNVHPEALLDVLSILTTFTILNSNETEEPESYALRAIEIAREFDDTKRNMVLNNLIFVYLETDRIEKTEKLISKLRFDTSKSEYPYATLGLLNLKKGNITAGKNYYGKAIGISSDQVQKQLFRQKLYFELGRLYLANNDMKKAISNLKKVVKIGVIKSSWTIDSYFKEASRLLSSL